MTSPILRSTPDDADRHRLAWAAWPADCTTPVRAFLALREHGRRPALLESVEGPARVARYSFVAVDPRASLRGTELTADGTTTRAGASAVEALRNVALARRKLELPRGLPPFCGGWVGFATYEWARELEPRVALAQNDVWKLPSTRFERFDGVLAFDHAAQLVYAIQSCAAGARDFAAAQEALEGVASDALGDAPASGELVLEGELRSSIDTPRFLEGVQRLKREISQGEIFQGVLSQRFEQRFRGDSFTLYRVLRITNPSPHMFYFPCDDLVLIGSSPERLVSVRGSAVESRPIAGTRPRGVSPEDDERLAHELRTSAKERAEHDMLVDLARNDLGRIARIGTVAVREHAVLERFARVQHLVSRVEAQLASDKDAVDVLAASFPAGTVSGAPKVRAMELIAEIEPDTRGPYAGAFGYLDGSGALDVALVIRSFVARGNTLSVQAGAGVVFDSEPEREHQETLDKARALFDAARMAGTEAFSSRTEVRA
jgi:anthranilate synthase component 1